MKKGDVIAYFEEITDESQLPPVENSQAAVDRVEKKKFESKPKAEKKK